MTDNTVVIDQDGIESVRVNRGDGLGISEIKRMGISQIIVSTEKNKVIFARAKKLGIPCLYGVECKEKTVQKYCIDHGHLLEDVVFIGNDINDLELMKIVGHKICPGDAQKEISDICQIVLKSGGGDGVIREFYNMLIKK